MYGMSGLAEKLNIQNCKNWTRLYVWNGWTCRKIENPKLHKFNGKLWTLYVQIVWICREIEYPELENLMGNYVYYMYGLSGFTEKLNF